MLLRFAPLAERLPSRRVTLLLAASAAFVVMPNKLTFREQPVSSTDVAQRGTVMPQGTKSVSPKGDRFQAEGAKRALHLEPSKAEAHEMGGMLAKAFPIVNRRAKSDALARQDGRPTMPKRELGPVKLDDIVGPALAMGSQPTPKVVAAFSPIMNGVRLLGQQVMPAMLPPASRIEPNAQDQTGSDGERRVSRAQAALGAGGYPRASMRCLAEAVYFEARGESEEGQAAVAQVIINRVHSEHYPDTVCDVVYQNRDWKNRCQFSFACDGIPDRIRNDEAWDSAQRVARDVGEGRTWLSDVAFSTHYHATYVKPRWIRDMVKTDKIGRHIFYRVRWWDQPTGDEEFTVEPAVAQSRADASLQPAVQTP